MTSELLPDGVGKRLFQHVTDILTFVDIANAGSDPESIDPYAVDVFFELLRRANLKHGQNLVNWTDYRRLLRAGLELALERLKP